MKAIEIIKDDIKSLSPQLKFMFSVPLLIFLFIFWAGFCASIIKPRFADNPLVGVPLYLIMAFSPQLLLLFGFYLYTVYNRSK